MPIVRATTTLVSTTGLPEDAATNTLYFDSGDVLGPDTENLLDMVEDFYTSSTAGGTIGSIMSNETAAGTGLIELYNLEDPKPRPAIAMRGFDYVPASVGGLPTEVALVLSFERAPIAGAVQARRRGRIYIPWLNTQVLDAGRPSATSGLVLASHGRELLLASNASLTNTWVVYSPTNDDTVVINRGWVDNAWDTQRRRGWYATNRLDWSTAAL